MRAVTDGVLRVVNPATLESVGTVEATDPAAVQELVAEARLVQERWRATSGAERKALLAAVAELALERADELAATVVSETGKPLVEAFTTELFPALDSLVWLASNATRTLAPERLRYPQLHLKHKRGWLLREPLGVVALVTPWNFPFAIPLTQVANAVAERAARVGRALDAGSVWHHDHAYSYATAQAAWGGGKSSGFGRTHAREGLLGLTATKFVDRDAGRVPVPWWFPYDDAAVEAFRGTLGVLYGTSARSKLDAAWQHRRGLVAMARRYRR